MKNKIIYIVTDEGKASYDAGGIFYGAFSSYEKALQCARRFGSGLVKDNADWVDYCSIEEHTLDSEV